MGKNVRNFGQHYFHNVDLSEANDCQMSFLVDDVIKIESDHGSFQGTCGVILDYGNLVHKV